MLRGSHLIIHAGDVGDPEIMSDLARLAPVTVVRGNIDRGVWADKLPPTEVLQVGEATIYVIHNIGELDLDPRAAEFQAVIYGHTHQPEIRRTDDVLYVSPGSAGPARFKLPISVGRLTVNGDLVEASLIDGLRPQQPMSVEHQADRKLAWHLEVQRKVN